MRNVVAVLKCVYQCQPKGAGSAPQPIISCIAKYLGVTQDLQSSKPLPCRTIGRMILEDITYSLRCASTTNAEALLRTTSNSERYIGLVELMYLTAAQYSSDQTIPLLVRLGSKPIDSSSGQSASKNSRQTIPSVRNLTVAAAESSLRSTNTENRRW